MYIILGGTGHIGSAVAETLLGKGEDVTIVSHNDKKAAEWKRKGAKFEIVNLFETDKLREVFKSGKRAFLLNPPGDITKDNVTEEKKTVASILRALENSGIEKVVAESTYGARKGEGIGDLGVLYDFEEGLRTTNIPTDVIRAAYYMSNWDASWETAQAAGIVRTLYPPDFKLPMAAPKDIGSFAAELLTRDNEGFRLHYVEGPEGYSSNDVAAAFGKALNKSVEAVQTPKDKWLPTLKQMGFSEIAARSMAKMTELTLENAEKPKSPVRGATTLNEYVENLIAEKNTSAE